MTTTQTKYLAILIAPSGPITRIYHAADIAEAREIAATSNWYDEGRVDFEDAPGGSDLSAADEDTIEAAIEAAGWMCAAHGASSADYDIYVRTVAETTEDITMTEWTPTTWSSCGTRRPALRREYRLGDRVEYVTIQITPERTYRGIVHPATYTLVVPSLSYEDGWYRDPSDYTDLAQVQALADARVREYMVPAPCGPEIQPMSDWDDRSGGRMFAPRGRQ